LVWWSSTRGDVYVAVRTLGGVLKASLHESGRCHVRAPDASKWVSPGDAPQFLDSWKIDPQSPYEFPFRVIIPASELRAGPWPAHSKRGTVWVPTRPGEAVEIGVFLTRVREPARLELRGWHTRIVVERLADGRDLWVLAGRAILPDDKRGELDLVRAQVRRVAPAFTMEGGHPQLLLFACDEQGTRCFVEAAL
jgi:hypothetical protein